VFQHLLRYIASNLPDGFVPGAALGKVGDERVPVIVPPTTHAGFFPNVAMMSSE
jgi:PhoPQ-activated pathogenicity-related protein